MNIVCIDTCFSSVAITAQGNAGTFTSVFTPAKARHSAILIPAIETAVKQAGFSINETDVLVCPQGPGGSILEALCSKYGDKNQFLSVIDAKRDCFYVQAFENKKPISEAFDIRAEDALKLIDKNKKTIICGFGTEKFNEEAGASIESNNITLIEADKETLSKTLLDCFLTNKNCKKVEDHEGPVYIRKSDAEY